MWARKTLWQTLHHCPLPPLICSCKKSKDELLSYVWCRHTGDYVLMFFIPVLLFFLLSSRMNYEQGWLWRHGECGPPGASVIPRVRYQNNTDVGRDVWLLCSAGMDTSSSPPSSPAYARLINGATLSFPVKQPEQADSGLLCVLKRQNLGQWSRPWTNNHICMHIQLKGHQDEFLVFTLEAFYLKRQCLLQMKSY